MKGVAEDRPARAIWEFVGRPDLSEYYECIQSSAEGGTSGLRPAVPDQHLGICLQRGSGSAREIARRYEWDPAFQWLTGGEAVNHHSPGRLARRAERIPCFLRTFIALGRAVSGWSSLGYFLHIECERQYLDDGQLLARNRYCGIALYQE